MSLIEIQKYFIESFHNAPIARAMSLTLTYNHEGEATISMPRDPNFDHGMRDTHGGIFATLMDSAGWFTVAAQCRKMVVTSDLHVRMLQGAKQQALVASAKMVRAGSRSAVAEMRLCTTNGELIATASASFALMDDLAL